MSKRTYQISTIGAISLTLNAGCDPKGDTGDTGGALDGFTGDGIVGTWDLKSMYGYNADTYFNYSYTYGECTYTYEVSISMTFASSSTSSYDGTLDQFYSYSDTCYPDYDYSYSYSYGMTAVAEAARSYSITSDDGDIALSCQVDGDTLTCQSVEDSDGDVVFER